MKDPLFKQIRETVLATGQVIVCTHNFSPPTLALIQLFLTRLQKFHKYIQSDTKYFNEYHRPQQQLKSAFFVSTKRLTNIAQQHGLTLELFLSELNTQSNSQLTFELYRQLANTDIINYKTNQAIIGRPPKPQAQLSLPLFVKPKKTTHGYHIPLCLDLHSIGQYYYIDTTKPNAMLTLLLLQPTKQTNFGEQLLQIFCLTAIIHTLNTQLINIAISPTLLAYTNHLCTQFLELQLKPFGEHLAYAEPIALDPYMEYYHDDTPIR